MARALTAKAVEALRSEPAKRQEIPDAALFGLDLVVQPSGVKPWALRSRHAGKPAKLTPGRWPVWGRLRLAAAAEAAGQVEFGRDPSAAMTTLQSMERIAGEPGYLFTTTGTTPVSGFAKGRDHIARAMARIAAEQRGRPVDVPRWTSRPAAHRGHGSGALRRPGAGCGSRPASPQRHGRRHRRRLPASRLRRREETRAGSVGAVRFGDGRFVSAITNGHAGSAARVGDG